MHACPDDHRIGEFLDGSLPMGIRDELEVHIDLCAPCRMALSHAGRLRESTPGRTADGTPTSASADELPGVGARVGRYQLYDVLGAGGMGVVYAARDPELDRRVAVKVMRDDIESSAGDERLRDEAQTLARVSHANVLGVYDVGRVGTRRFLAMELVDGTTLRGYLARRAVDWRDRVRLLVDAGRGLAAAHDVGVVHRDVKPDNILIGADGRPRVSDFGLARLAVPPGSPASTGVESTAAGTPAYLAPELRAGARATVASDQYAFATMCWEVLCGTRPAWRPAVAGQPRALRRVLVVLLRGLADAPAARWPSIGALVDALVVAARPPRRDRALFFGAAVVVAVGVAAAIVALGAGADRLPAACAAIEPRAAALWSEARVAAMRATFARSPQSFASDSATGVEGGLGRATAAWSSTALAVCQHDPAGYAQGAGAVECLERRFAEIDALAALFSSGDPPVDRAPAVIASLPSSASCLDGRTPLEPPRPAAWLEMARRLSGLFAALDVDRRDEIGATAEAVVRDADAAGARALHAEALLILAELARIEGRLDDAERLIRESVLVAERGGADPVRARGLIELGRLLARDRVRPEDAIAPLEQARAVLDRLGQPPQSAVHLAQTEADVAMARRQPSVAIESLRHALDIIATAGLTWFETGVRTDLGGAYMAVGRHAEGLAEFERNLAARASSVSGRILASLHMNVAGALYVSDRVGDAVAHGELAVATLRELGESRMLAQGLGNLAFFYEALDRSDESIAAAEESLRMTERVLGRGHPDVALRTQNLADLHDGAGRQDEALALFRDAIALHVAALGKETPALSYPLSRVAEIELALGHVSAAVASAERAREVLRAARAAGAEETDGIAGDTRRVDDVLARARAHSRNDAPRRKTISGGPAGAPTPSE